MRYSLLLVFSCIIGVLTAQSVQSPLDFIGNKYGSSFTPHHILVDYVQHVAENSPLVDILKYGETNESRPLYLLFISSEKNIDNLSEIQQSNLNAAGIFEEKDNSEYHLPIVWLSYSIHGNEAGGSEASMNVLYSLVSGNHEFGIDLSEVLIIMDPSVNPDGYSRYSSWINSIQGKSIHPKHIDVEHMEPWPGGRVNHYLFDLNRDWAWQTQVESKQRAKIYNQWLPHVHADLHEMGYDDHYYFAPAAEPYHSAVTDWQRNLQTSIGKNHASYFDKNGWLYFTGEVFDLLYPSYGDTWPTFNGSVGMTYEQAGHGFSGRAVEMSNGKNLTIQDRIDHHTTTSLSTIETTIKNKDEVLRNFESYFEKSNSNPFGEFKYYIIPKGEFTDEFTALLKNNGIKYSYLSKGKKLNGHSFVEDKSQAFIAETGDIFISAYQPKSTLLQVLMEKSPVLSDSLTYDITSWCLPLAYNLDCYGFTNKPTVELTDVVKKDKEVSSLQIGNYGVIFHYDFDFDSKKILSDLLKRNVAVRTAIKEIIIGEIIINRGDFLVLKADQKEDSWEEIVAASVSSMNYHSEALQSGFSSSGNDLGGSSLSLVEKPKVLCFFGESVNANSYGQVWNYFENDLHYPLSRVDIERIDGVDLKTFNTIILPDGYYSLEDKTIENIREWVMSGGKLISIAGANSMLKKDKIFGLSKRLEDNDNGNSVVNSLAKDNYRKRNYEGAERRSISGSMPGAVIHAEIDKTHPLCFGLDYYYTLKNSSAKYPLLDPGAYNPIRIPKNYNYYGFIGSTVKHQFEETFVVAEENIGRGKVVYLADNPLFRGFWKGGEIIFANALFQLN